MKKRQYIYLQIVSAICAAILFFILFLPGFGAVNVRAETSAGKVYDNSNVLSDLQKSSDFKIEDYPYDSSDYSIYVIQVAESEKGFLYLYTYQPCQNKTPLTATQINMSLAESVTGTQLYDLQQVGTNGVFAKYLVKGVTVKNDPIRYYNITSICRDFIKGVDSPTDNGGETLYKNFPVGRLYAAETVNGNIKYSCIIRDVVDIINPYVDFISYYNGLTWGSFFGLDGDSYTDVHYIAFSTDKQIDTLKEADVTYTTQSYKFEPFGGGTTYGEKSAPQYKRLTGDMTGSTQGGGFTAQKYSWKCIQRTEDFIKTTTLNSVTSERIKDSEFVLVFLTTEYKQKEVYSLMQGHGFEKSGTKVSDVSILRLLFETNGKTYNLGAVMDIVEADDIPGNQYAKENIGFWEYIWRCIVRLFNGTATFIEAVVAVLAIFVCVLALPILLTVLSLVFPAFGSVMKVILKGLWIVIKYFFIGLWYVISAPVRLIILIVHKVRGE